MFNTWQSETEEAAFLRAASSLVRPTNMNALPAKLPSPGGIRLPPTPPWLRPHWQFLRHIILRLFAESCKVPVSLRLIWYHFRYCIRHFPPRNIPLRDLFGLPDTRRRGL